MASSGHLAQKSQHWRKIHIDQWDEGGGTGGVEGQSAINSDLHPRSSAKGGVWVCFKGKPTEVEQGVQLGHRAAPRQTGQSPSVLRISNINIYFLLNTLVETMLQVYILLPLPVHTENFTFPGSLKLDWFYFLAEKDVGKALIQGFPKSDPNIIFS